MEGTRITFHDNGTIQSMLHYKDDKLQGHCQWWHENGVLARESTYKAGAACFLTRVWDEDRRIMYADAYHADNAGYTRISYHEDGAPHKEKNFRIVEGVPRMIGLQRAWWGNGRVRYICHRGADGMNNGPSVQFYNTGTKKAEYNWVGGVLQGDFTTYYTCGKKHMEGSFAAGELHGKYVEWAADGGLVRHASFWNGVEITVHYDAYAPSSGESSLYGSPLAMGIC
jgi:antitoxin component YwqK of YwqJK toxin-antitoxin module